MKRSNCLLYALGQMRKQGGYIIASPGIHYPWIWHFQHAQSLGNLRISEYVPKVPRPGLPLWMAIWELCLHEGQVRHTYGDCRRVRFNLIRKRRWGERFRNRWPTRRK